MKYMTTWKMYPGCHQACAEAFLASGAQPPEGMAILGRWRAPGSNYGWVLSEGDIVVIAQHMATWAKYLDVQITPVIEDDQAGAALAKVYG